MRPTILKLDDISRRSSELAGWNEVFDYIVDKKIEASAGVICKDLRFSEKLDQDWIKKYKATNLVEFWNHGYSHKKMSKFVAEFYNTTYEEQYESIRLAQNAGRHILGNRFTTFGAPFNLSDKNTAEALTKFPEIKVWFSGTYQVQGCKILKKTQLAELNHCEVSFDYFIDMRKKRNNLAYDVLQFHPGGWKEKSSIVDFKKIIDYLINEEGVKFITPTKYAASLEVKIEN